MRGLREKHPRTRVIVVDRRALWTFREMEPRIAKIFSQKNYSLKPPQIAMSNHTAMMHAKYELMQWTIRDNPFRSAYIAWLDVGFFRHLANQSVSSTVASNNLFQLGIPPDLHRDAVGYTVVVPSSPNPTLTAEAVVKANMVWLAGGFFIGRVDVMCRWTTEYLTAVEQMVSENWMSADEHVIIWLMLGEGKTKIHPRTNLQLYKTDDGSNPWFYLGYLAKKIGEQNSLRPT